MSKYDGPCMGHDPREFDINPETGSYFTPEELGNVRLPDSELDEVDVLIGIADAGVKERRGHWYTLGIPLPVHYNLDEQLDAIRQLGVSGDPRALEYLRDLSEEKLWSESPDIVDHNCDYGGGSHPHAKGKLAEALSHRHTAMCPPPGFSDKLKDKGAVLVIANSILQLEESLKE